MDLEFQMGTLGVLVHPVTLVWPRSPGGCFQMPGPVKESDLPAVTKPWWEPKARSLRGKGRGDDRTEFWLTHSLSIHKISPGYRLSTSGPAWGAQHMERTQTPASEAFPVVGEAET